MTSSRFRLGHVAAVLATMTLATHASAVVLYADDFADISATAAKAWTLNAGALDATAFSIVPNTASGYGQFLGEFGGSGNDQDVLGLHYSNTLLQNATVTISFDFFAIRSWDGDDSLWGKDFFKVGINGDTVLNDTFSNGAGTQTYGPDSNNAPMTGSKEQYSLGYTFWDGINEKRYDQDAVYRFVFSFDSVSSDLDLLLTSLVSQTMWVDNDPESPNQRYRDESWGIDNLTISAIPHRQGPTAIPAPGTMAMVGLGLLGIGIGIGRRFSFRQRP